MVSRIISSRWCSSDISAPRQARRSRAGSASRTMKRTSARGNDNPIRSLRLNTKISPLLDGEGTFFDSGYPTALDSRAKQDRALEQLDPRLLCRQAEHRHGFVRRHVNAAVRFHWCKEGIAGTVRPRACIRGKEWRTQR